MNAAQELYESVFARAKQYVHALHTQDDLSLAELTKNEEYAQFRQDLDEFSARLDRKEYTEQQARALLDVVKTVRYLFKSKAESITESVNQLEISISNYTKQSPTITAMEMQFETYHHYDAIMKRAGTPGGWSEIIVDTHDFREIMIEQKHALGRAGTYVWAPETTRGVAAASAGLLDEFEFNETSLADLGRPGASSWWWFQEPIKVAPFSMEFCSILIWRYGTTLVCQLFESTVVRVSGHHKVIPVPTYAFTVNIQGKESVATFRRKLRGDPETVGISQWFGCFVLAAATWLRSKVVVDYHAEGTRQVARQIQRKAQLSARPDVRIVELRRREIVRRQDVEDVHAPSDAAKREWKTRWIVHGFMRNQWYPSKRQHAPIWIDDFVKGPADKPLKVSPTVFAVRR